MYICVCNAIRECQLREAARRCPGDPDAFTKPLGAGLNVANALTMPLNC